MIKETVNAMAEKKTTENLINDTEALVQNQWTKTTVRWLHLHLSDFSIEFLTMKKIDILKAFILIPRWLIFMDIYNLPETFSYKVTIQKDYIDQLSAGWGHLFTTYLDYLALFLLG